MRIYPCCNALKSEDKKEKGVEDEESGGVKETEGKQVVVARIYLGCNAFKSEHEKHFEHSDTPQYRTSRDQQISSVIGGFS